MPDLFRLSGRVKKTPPANVDPNRYSFINLENVEPDLGVPLFDNAIAASDVDGTRKWLYLNIDGSNVEVGGNITLSTTLDEVTTRGNTTTNGITIGNLTVDNIFLDSNTISTLNNANLILDPTGSGTVILESPLTQNATTAPSTPSANSMVTYVTASGTTPNREIAWKIKNQSGEEVIVSTVLV
jgi:hypothetical protein